MSWSFVWISSIPLRYARRVFAMFDLESAVEVVHDRQELEQETDDGFVGVLAALAFDALAVVVEFGGLSEQPIVVVVPLALQRGRFRILFRRRGSIRIVRQCLVSHGRPS